MSAEQPKSDTHESRDEVPGDIRAFFGHPLMSGGASSLLHEYEKSFGVGQRRNINIETDDVKEENQDYSTLLTNDEDAFLYRNDSDVLQRMQAEHIPPLPRSYSEKQFEDNDFEQDVDIEEQIVELHEDVITTETCVPSVPPMIEDVSSDMPPMIEDMSSDIPALSEDIADEVMPVLTTQTCFREDDLNECTGPPELMPFTVGESENTFDDSQYEESRVDPAVHEDIIHSQNPPIKELPTDKAKKSSKKISCTSQGRPKARRAVRCEQARKKEGSVKGVKRTTKTVKVSDTSGKSKARKRSAKTQSADLATIDASVESYWYSHDAMAAQTLLDMSKPKLSPWSYNTSPQTPDRTKDASQCSGSQPPEYANPIQKNNSWPEMSRNEPPTLPPPVPPTPEELTAYIRNALFQPATGSVVSHVILPKSLLDLVSHNSSSVPASSGSGDGSKETWAGSGVNCTDAGTRSVAGSEESSVSAQPEDMRVVTPSCDLYRDALLLSPSSRSMPPLLSPDIGTPVHSPGLLSIANSPGLLDSMQAYLKFTGRSPDQSFFPFPDVRFFPGMFPASQYSMKDPYEFDGEDQKPISFQRPIPSLQPDYQRFTPLREDDRPLFKLSQFVAGTPQSSPAAPIKPAKPPLQKMTSYPDDRKSPTKHYTQLQANLTYGEVGDAQSLRSSSGKEAKCFTYPDATSRYSTLYSEHRPTVTASLSECHKSVGTPYSDPQLSITSRYHEDQSRASTPYTEKRITPSTSYSEQRSSPRPAGSYSTQMNSPRPASSYSSELRSSPKSASSYSEPRSSPMPAGTERRGTSEAKDFGISLHISGAGGGAFSGAMGGAVFGCNTNVSSSSVSECAKELTSTNTDTLADRYIPQTSSYIERTYPRPERLLLADSQVRLSDPHVLSTEQLPTQLATQVGHSGSRDTILQVHVSHDNQPGPSSSASPYLSNMEMLARGDAHRSSCQPPSLEPKSKRRKSALTSNRLANRLHNLYPKIDPAMALYKYCLEAPTSPNQKLDDDRITYLNKGQNYTLVLEYLEKSRPMRSGLVMSLLAVVFGDHHTLDEELRGWQVWHRRQASYLQRSIEICTEESRGIDIQSVQEVAHNAIVFHWQPLEMEARVSFSVHCLSTDFSNQKGVKGMPLHLHVDTYECKSDPLPTQRGYCRIKVFCDKGAERKIRDEEKKKHSRFKQTDNNPVTQFHTPSDRSEFYLLADLSRPPVLYTPSPDLIREHVGPPSYELPPPPLVSPPLPVIKPVPYASNIETKMTVRTPAPAISEGPPKVLLYVREPHEEFFTALMLFTPTVESLAFAIEEKYHIPAKSIRHIFKHSRKGIMVKMDENMIKHYTNESSFVMSIRQVDEQSKVDIIMGELDTSVPS